MIFFFAACAFALVQSEEFYKKKELSLRLDVLINDTYGGDQKRSSCMKKHLQDKKKYPKILEVPNHLEGENLTEFLKEFIEVELKECTAYSWFYFFISAMALLSLICLSIYVVDCVCTKMKGEQPKNEKEKSPSV